MSTKEQPCPFDGMVRAAPDEPVFTLRAHDVLAPALVHEWVRQRREAITVANLSDEKRDLELIQCREAEEIAWSMVDWRNGTHPIEEPEEDKTPAPYSAHTSSAEELAAKRRYDVVKGSASSLNNALSEAEDVAEALEEYGYPSERAAILAEVDKLKAVAIHIAPKRASYSLVDPEPEPFTPQATGLRTSEEAALHMHPDLVDGERS